jgi:hypothetical protein
MAHRLIVAFPPRAARWRGAFSHGGAARGKGGDLASAGRGRPQFLAQHEAALRSVNGFQDTRVQRIIRRRDRAAARCAIVRAGADHHETDIDRVIAPR